MTLLFVLLGAATWNKEIASVFSDFSTNSLQQCLILFDKESTDLTLFYLDLYRMSNKTGNTWSTKDIHLPWVRAVAYDQSGVLAAVSQRRYAGNDSIYLSYYPDVNDTIHCAKLDSMPNSYTPHLSNLVFKNNTPMFFYTHFAEYEFSKEGSFLKYAKEDNNNVWEIEIIDSARWNPGDEGRGMVEPRASFGPDNSLYVIYVQHNAAGGGSLRLAKNAGSGWTIETLDSAQNIPGMSAKSFAVDKNGYVHVLHSHDRRVFYTTNKSGGWCTDTVYKLTGYEQMAYCWLSLTPWGLPEGIANDCDWDGTILSHYFHYDGSVWHHDTVPYVSWFDIDRWGNPHIMAIDTFYYQPPDTVFHYWLPVGVEEPVTPATPSLQLDVTALSSIRYSLPSGERGTLTVYDPSGRRVESLRVQGEGQVAMKAGLSSGVYFVKLESGKTSVTKKAVVLR